jgi:hypothetical protein
MIAPPPSGLFYLRSIPLTGAAKTSAGIIGNVALGRERINNKELIRVARYGTLVPFRSNFNGEFICLRLPCFVRRDTGRVPEPIFFNGFGDA